MGLELESSKNYFYKLELLQGSKSMEQENLLDPDYENNLDLNNFLFWSTHCQLRSFSHSVILIYLFILMYLIFINYPLYFIQSIN